LIQIDSLMAEAVRRGGAWIACRPGCCECCIGPFSISQSDAARLREGIAQLDAAIALRVRDRARNYIAAIHSYDEEGLPEGMDDIACPVLDPANGTCDLYDARPITCRTFGPAVKTSDGAVATCELCFKGASEDRIAACAVEIDRGLLELDAPSATLVALALSSF
jgi:Fe-S-cluster containining protein